MADETAVAEPVKGTGKIVSAGKPTSFQVNVPLADQMQQNQNAGTAAAENTELNDTEKANIAAGLNIDGSKNEHLAVVVNETPEEIAAKSKLAEIQKPLTDEAVLEYLKSKGKDISSLDEISNPIATETPEQKIAKEKAFEKRMLDLYIAGGGDLDQFTLLKQVANTDLTELSKVELTKELKAQGFNDAEIAVLQKERLEQLSDEELEQFEDESAKDFAKRKRDYDKFQIENRGKELKENAVDFLNNLKEAVNQKDLFTQKESEFVSNVEAHFKGVERKMTLQLGKAGDADISPVEYEVPEEIIAEAEAILKNPATRKQLLFNTTDGSLNLKNIAELVLKGKMFDSAAKTSYLTGATREVEKFEAIFPKNANALGVGGNNQANTSKPGKIVSAGQPQRFKPAVGQ